ncbi:unnamed protein product, partial [Didymodactylos carnosus]
MIFNSLGSWGQEGHIWSKVATPLILKPSVYTEEQHDFSIQEYNNSSSEAEYATAVEAQDIDTVSNRVA